MGISGEEEGTHMPKLNHVYDNEADIPEGFQELYSERNGKFELTGINGIKTQADVDRIQSSLSKERADHRATREALAKFSGIDAETVHAQLEELDGARAQLEAFTKDGKLDEAKLEPVIQARVKSALGPVEREKAQLARALEEQKKITSEREQENAGLKGTLRNGSIERTIREAAARLKLVPTAIDDAVMAGLNVLDVAEDGAIVTKDVQGVTPGIGAADWLKDMQDKRPHWWPQSQGGGAQGGKGGPANRAENPWTKEGWNLTKQGQLVKTIGAAKAGEMAKAAGVSLGATKPAAA